MAFLSIFIRATLFDTRNQQPISSNQLDHPIWTGSTLTSIPKCPALLQHVQPPASNQPDQKLAAVASLASLSTATPGDQSMQEIFLFHH
jgi:hypothetical protein